MLNKSLDIRGEHANITPEQFAEIVSGWLTEWRKSLYTNLPFGVYTHRGIVMPRLFCGHISESRGGAAMVAVDENTDMLEMARDFLDVIVEHDPLFDNVPSGPFRAELCRYAKR